MAASKAPHRKRLAEALRAKTDRRRASAALPFTEKVRIVLAMRAVSERLRRDQPASSADRP